MNLRNKIITVVASVMFFSLLILLLFSVVINLYTENQKKFEIEQTLKRVFPRVFRSGDTENFILFLNGIEVLRDWRLVEDGKLMARSGNNDAPDLKILYISCSLFEEKKIKLQFAIRRGTVLKQAHLNFFITGLLCTLFLAIILYMLLSRLVVHPVDIVINAGREASQGMKPGRNPIPGRKDEAGVMVKEFYNLLSEVYEYRKNLENRIREASEELGKKNEQLVVSQRLSATGTLAAGIAHEINNPLGGMMNAINTLKKSSSDQKEKEYLELLEECVGRIEKLVKDLLSFVRSSKGFEQVDMGHCIDFCEKLISHFLREKSVELVKKIEEGVSINGDRSELQQMFLNLLLNAIDSIEGGGEGIIEVCASSDPETGTVTVVITDNGMGIPEDEIDQVFDLFYTSKEAGKGTGLGLSIVHSIVGRHGGSIGIASEEGKETRVTIEFPSPDIS